jgi:hypothetical protein
MRQSQAVKWGIILKRTLSYRNRLVLNPRYQVPVQQITMPMQFDCHCYDARTSDVPTLPDAIAHPNLNGHPKFDELYLESTLRYICIVR